MYVQRVDIIKNIVFKHKIWNWNQLDMVYVELTWTVQWMNTA